VAIACDVDVLASRKHGTLTIGVTNDIARRAWRIRLLERDNPEWDDLDDRVNGPAIGSRQQVPGRQRWLRQGRPLLT
jgi:predicted GIY-YIG superfamily endonuclease